MFPSLRIYVFADENLIFNLRKEILRNNKTLKDFAKIKNIKVKTLYSWLNTKARIPLKFIEDVLGVKDYIELENYYICSRNSNYSIRLNKKLDIKEAIIIGWIISEGHLDKQKLTISQSKKETLLKLKAICEKIYPNLNAEIYKDKESFKLQLPTISSLYHNYVFKIPFGKKSRITAVPRQIKEGSNEVKYAFLMSYLEGDGSTSPYKTKYLKRPRISISSFSKEFTKGIMNLLES